MLAQSTPLRKQGGLAHTWTGFRPQASECFKGSLLPALTPQRAVGGWCPSGASGNLIHLPWPPCLSREEQASQAPLKSCLETQAGNEGCSTCGQYGKAKNFLRSSLRSVFGCVLTASQAPWMIMENLLPRPHLWASPGSQ